MLILQGMTARGGKRKRGPNWSMREQCLGMVMQNLAYKTASAGGELVRVSPHYTKQRCSCGGGMPDKSIGLQVRTYRYAHCSLELDRDGSTARNIPLKRLSLFSRAGSPVCRAEGVEAPDVESLVAEMSDVRPAAKFNHDTGWYAWCN